MRGNLLPLVGRSIMSTVACIIFTLCMFHVSLQAQPIGTCPPVSSITCSGVTVYNCTGSPLQVSFKLCCNGVTTISSYVSVPNVACTVPAGFYNFSPCTLMDVDNIITTSSIIPLYRWDRATCSLIIYL